MNSDLSGFYNLSVAERRAVIKKQCDLTDEEAAALKDTGCLDKLADMMIENVIGTVELPLGIATNFRVNGKDVLVPMAIEEPSVVAAASHAAKLARPEGFSAHSTEPIMIGQIQLMDTKPNAKELILKEKTKIENLVNKKDSTLIKLGGGMRDIEVREVESSRGKMVIVHLLVNVQDAMGANAVNTMCECIAPYLEQLSGGRSVLKIISNLAVHRTVKASVTWKKETLDEDIIEGILDGYELAKVDKFRCATHNKGIMNGIDSVMIATGNDFRAAEAGAHAFAATAESGYRPLTHYEKTASGDLKGSIELPMVAGIVGGATKTSPIAKVSLKILGVKKAHELGEIAACVGLANNFAALRAMAKEGIQAGHMRLHANNLALSAGATHEEVLEVAKRMIGERQITNARAREILKELRNR